MQRQKRLKQVWSSSIDTPEILRIKFLGRACCWAFTQMSAAILECFAAISYLFRETRSAFNALQTRSGLKIYRCRGVWRIIWLDGPVGGDVSESSLDQQYKPHLQTLMRRTEQSLQACGF